MALYFIGRGKLSLTSSSTNDPQIMSTVGQPSDFSYTCKDGVIVLSVVTSYGVEVHKCKIGGKQ